MKIFYFLNNFYLWLKAKIGFLKMKNLFLTFFQQILTIHSFKEDFLNHHQENLKFFI